MEKQSSTRSISLANRLNLFLFPFLLGASELVKILYVTTCDCRAIGQPFNAWFFPAFQHSPWSFWWTYHGITWLAGPYSILWWVLNSPAFFGYWVFFSYLLVLDFSLTMIFLRKVSVFWASLWTLFSVWWVLLDPVDFFPMSMIFLGRYRWPFLALAIVTKLPFGAPFWVWQWTFTSSNSFQGQENWSRYGILGVFWTISLGYRLLASPSVRVRLAAHGIGHALGTAEDER